MNYLKLQEGCSAKEIDQAFACESTIVAERIETAPALILKSKYRMYASLLQEAREVLLTSCADPATPEMLTLLQTEMPDPASRGSAQTNSKIKSRQERYVYQTTATIKQESAYNEYRADASAGKKKAGEQKTAAFFLYRKQTTAAALLAVAILAGALFYGAVQLRVQRSDEETKSALRAQPLRAEEKKKAAATADNAVEEKEEKSGSAQAEEKKIFTNTLGQSFIYLSPGAFIMGSHEAEKNRDSDEVQHTVALIKGFYLQATEVTQGQWRALTGNNPSKFKDCGDDCPVENVSWSDCKAFIAKLNFKEGTGTYRMPTEAEWEYAARADSIGAYGYGDNESRLGLFAWYDKNSEGAVHPAGRKQANSLGLYDMHGNVWEWCEDFYAPYQIESAAGPAAAANGSARLLRGGCWLSAAGSCRSANRYTMSAALRNGTIGFRLAKEE